MGLRIFSIWVLVRRFTGSGVVYCPVESEAGTLD